MAETEEKHLGTEKTSGVVQGCLVVSTQDFLFDYNVRLLMVVEEQRMAQMVARCRVVERCSYQVVGGRKVATQNSLVR
jgi:hypothetical protein